jgi:hypothetical protein
MTDFGRNHNEEISSSLFIILFDDNNDTSKGKDVY